MQTTRYIDDFREAMVEVFEDEAREAEEHATSLARRGATLLAWRRHDEAEKVLRWSREQRILALRIRAEGAALLRLLDGGPSVDLDA
jgi:hypothetical protein